MSSRNVATKTIKPIRLITLDMTGTVFRVNISKECAVWKFKIVNLKFYWLSIGLFKLYSLRPCTLHSFLQFKRAPYFEYVDIASLYGIDNLASQKVSECFKQSIKDINNKFPNFGATTSITSKDWWCKVVNNTFKGRK